jgi:hypothetical protein
MLAKYITYTSVSNLAILVANRSCALGYMDHDKISGGEMLEAMHTSLRKFVSGLAGNLGSASH